jgi:hypothetical protein
MFRKLDLFPSSDEARETLTMLGPLQRANLNHSRPIEELAPSPHLKKETHPLSETFRFLVI